MSREQRSVVIAFRAEMFLPWRRSNTIYCHEGTQRFSDGSSTGSPETDDGCLQTRKKSTPFAWAPYPRRVGFSVLFREDSAMTPTPVDLHATPEAYYPKNYGDTSSNTDIRCGLEGVGTGMRRGPTFRATPLDRSSGQGAAAALRFASARPSRCTTAIFRCVTYAIFSSSRSPRAKRSWKLPRHPSSAHPTKLSQPTEIRT